MTLDPVVDGSDDSDATRYYHYLREYFLLNLARCVLSVISVASGDVTP